MTRWLKGIAHLSAFEAIEQIKNAKDEEEKKRLIQKEWERRKKIRQMTNMMVGHAVSLNIERPDPVDPKPRIEVKGLTVRSVDGIVKLDDVSFTIEDGEMVGYIGPNGAGKSSTIKILSGILTPDCGECRINGRVPWENRIRHVAEIGVVFGQRSQLWWDVPVADSFELLKDIYQIDEALYRKNRDELTELLNLSQLLRTPARQLSLGQRMRCEIAASLLHSPKLLFLDEPTIGLDAVSKLAVRDFIKQLNAARHTTVILTTHDMQDIEALASRILLIGKGKILMDGTLDDIRKGGESIDETVASLYQQYDI